MFARNYKFPYVFFFSFQTTASLNTRTIRSIGLVIIIFVIHSNIPLQNLSLSIVIDTILRIHRIGQVEVKRHCHIPKLTVEPAYQVALPQFRISTRRIENSTLLVPFCQHSWLLRYLYLLPLLSCQKLIIPFLGTLETFQNLLH